MSLKRPWATMTVIEFVLSLVGSYFPGVWAQTSDNTATCLPGWEWNQNTLGQDPCLVASVLEAACRGIDSYRIHSLHGSYYSPPQRDTPGDLACECDTVTYSLYMACTKCQGEDRGIYSWFGYISQCDTISIGLYPHNIPNGTAIPRWAFYDITSIPDQTYNDTLAMTIGRDPEATPEPPKTDPSHKKKGINSIVGGVVGGVALLLILALVAALVIRRRRNYRAQETLAHFQGQPTPPDPSANLTLYDPSDPSTFPPPMDEIQSTSIHTSIPSPHGQHRSSSTRWT